MVNDTIQCKQNNTFKKKKFVEGKVIEKILHVEVLRKNYFGIIHFSLTTIYEPKIYIFSYSSSAVLYI